MGLQGFLQDCRVVCRVIRGTSRVAGLCGGLQGLPVGLQGLTSTTIRGGLLLCKHSSNQFRSGCHDSGLHLSKTDYFGETRLVLHVRSSS